MKFFKPEDFVSFNQYPAAMNMIGVIANIANEKLEREGRIVYSRGLPGAYAPIEVTPDPKYKALLINIQALIQMPAKEPCLHENVKVSHVGLGEFYCLCGARVEPLTFQGMK